MRRWSQDQESWLFGLAGGLPSGRIPDPSNRIWKIEGWLGCLLWSGSSSPYTRGWLLLGLKSYEIKVLSLYTRCGSGQYSVRIGNPPSCLYIWGWLLVDVVPTVIISRLLSMGRGVDGIMYVLHFGSFALVAQWIEQPPSKRRVAGSNPA